jgi:polyhydroxyalkanoate synthase subunit PhaE
METFDYGKALADMWAQGGKAFLEAQQQAFRAMGEAATAMGMPGATMPAVAPVPALPNLALDAGEAARAGQALAELWSSATGLAGTLAQRLPGGMDPDSTVAATLRRMVDPRVWLSAGDDTEEALQRMAEGPRLADLWEVERRHAKVFQAWMALRRRGLEHQAVVLEGWTTAARRFAERLGALTGKGEAPATGRAALDLWIETANRALLEMQRSGRYLASQAELLKASTELRLAQQEVAEHWGRTYGLPTRAELDDVHRSVTELRRELRATQRRLRAAEANQAARGQERPAAAAAAPAQRRATAAAAPGHPARRSAKAEG